MKTTLFRTLLLLAVLGPQFLTAQQANPFGEIRKADKNSTLNMHLCPEGEFAVGKDQWGKIVRVNMLKIRDWSKVPGVKKAWVMKGFEGEEGMAFHPIISEVKDVDGDGKPDIFRCQSEHEGARIERLRYDDGSIVWESAPMAALHGDESRLPVYDLDGDGVHSVLHATKGGTWCVNADTGKTEWSAKEAVGDIIVGHFLDKKRQAVLVRSGGTLRCYDDKGRLRWTHESGLRGGDAYAHEAYRHDADGDGLDEIFVNWQKRTMALKGDGTILWEDKTQPRHSDYLVCADVDADGTTEFLYDHHEGSGPTYVVDAMTGAIKMKIDYRKDGLGNAQNMAVGDFDPASKGLEVAICGKLGNLFVWDSTGKKLWNRNVPSSLLSKGDWDGDGVEDIACFALGANVDGMFSVWNGKGERLYAISFLPSPSRRTWSDKHKGGSWSHAMPGGHEGIRRQLDLDGDGCADFIMPFGTWHWGSDAILFLMEGEKPDRLEQPFLSSLTRAAATTYYVDPAGGKDDRKGTSAASAWRSLSSLENIEFHPGDRILLKAGCRFVGSLHPKGSGADGKPIVIDRYGEGDNPVVAGEGKVENTIRLHNQSHWEIRNLTVTNTDGGGSDDEGRLIRRAVYVTAEDLGEVRHLHLSNLEIRDVRGMYRFKGHQTNGGIICELTGSAKEARFVDLRIEDCVFRTASIDRYPLVVTSPWRDHPGEIIYHNNTLDHTGRAHIVIPADQWPRKLVYYFDPEVRKVFPLDRTAAPVSPFTGRVGCEDIFSEMAARLKRSWSFYEATRAKEGKWRFKYQLGDKDYSLWATSSDALAYYGEIRALGFQPPWIENEAEVMDQWISGINKHLDPKTNLLNGPARGAPRSDSPYLSHSYDWISRNRVFTADRYSLPPGGLHGGDPLPTKEAAIKRFNSFNWNGNTYQVCNVLGKEIKSRAEILRSKGLDPAKDEIITMLHEMLDKKFVDGRWGKGGTADGNMKMGVTYCTYDWPIPDHKALIDFTLDGANGQFKGRGCGAFNQMWVLAEARRQFPDGYRGKEIAASLAQSFLTFLGNWNEQHNFYSNNWRGKHNNGVPLFISHLILDLPVMRGSAVYNWRLNPIITRGEDGSITRNEVTYTTPGFLFYD